MRDAAPSPTNPTNTMNKTTLHPIEVALAVLLATCESALWIINELLGHHSDPATNDPATYTETNDIIDMTWDEVITSSYPGVGQWYVDHVNGLTVRQLQEIVGTKSSRYRKADLIEMAIAA